MAGRFVRASKYRHVYGQSTKKEQCYDNLRISRNAWDTNLVKANPQYLSVNWEASGGGAFAVIPVNERGKLPERLPLFRGHTAAVLDTDWNPFDDSLLASGSDDGKVFLWRVPESFTLITDAEEPGDVPPVGRLTGHSRKVGHVLFNPSARNVLASSSGDFTIKIWDIEQGKDRLVLKHADIVQSLSWNASGSLMATTSRDKKLRVWDVRQEKPVQEVAGHSGAKNSRAVWLGELDRVATTGFSRMSDRQLGLWDIKNPTAPINDFQQLDSISGVCMPFWDDGNKILYLAGKGDGNIRYFEFTNDKFEYLSEYKSADPQRGVAFVPKRGVNVHENEIARAYKTVNDSHIEPVSFIVPRRAEVFQTDIYPPTFGVKSAMSSGEWFDGKTGVPPLISLKGRYDGEESSELSPEEKAMVEKNSSAAFAVASPSPTKTEAPAPKPVEAASAAPASAKREVAPATATSAPKVELKDNKQAMADMASKFADKDDDDDDDDDDSSSFEEVTKPVERPVRAIDSSKPIQPAAATMTRPVTTTTTAAAPTSKPTPTTSAPIATATAIAPAAAKATPDPAHSGASSTNGGPAEALKTHLSDIKAAQASTNSEISELKAQVHSLQELVKTLSTRLDTLVGSQAERIRRIELEVEGLRE